MNKKLKIVFITVAVIGLLGFFGYEYIMHGGERNLESEEASFTISAKKLADEFSKNTDASNKKYLEKAIEIEGTTTSVNTGEVTVNNAVFCILKDTTATVKENQVIKIKGRVVGYDDLLGEVKLDQCFILK